jgi:hypothetical protein
MIRAVLTLLTAAVPALAAAQVVDPAVRPRLDLIGDAPSACMLQAPTAGPGANAALERVGPLSGQVRITRLVDPNTLEPQAASIDLAFPLICNSAHRLIVRTARGGLVLDTPAPPATGFRDRLSYTVEAEWAGARAEGSSDSRTPVDIAVSDGAAGVVSVSIRIPGGGAPLVAGAYSDSVVVELQPAN